MPPLAPKTRFLMFLAGFCLAFTGRAIGQAADEHEGLAHARQLFDPPVTTIQHENRAIPSAVIQAISESAKQRSAVEGWLARRGVVVLNADRPGLTLHFHADGIEAMTRIDRLWEGLPKRADSLQDLIDHAITRSRESGRPIAHLIIAGHAGLPGCAAFGGTLDDCVFEGRLTTYQSRQLVRLRPYLAKDAEIELRQCVTGRGAEGQRLLTALYHTTGVTSSSYLADFHFGDSANHPRVRVDAHGVKFIQPK